MSDKPILFSKAMVRALLAGTKTQTRRIAKLAKGLTLADVRNWRENADGTRAAIWEIDQIATPRIKVGDRLWVKETSRITSWGDDGDVWITYLADEARSGVLYPDDEEFLERLCNRVEKAGAKLDGDGRYIEIPAAALSRPSIFMPRWASRITLTITDVRVERLQDISEVDAKAEGLTSVSKDGRLFKWGIPDRDGLPGTDDFGWPWTKWDVDPRQAYRALWEAINGPGSWDANPWVAAYTFTVQLGNIDQLAEAA